MTFKGNSDVKAMRAGIDALHLSSSENETFNEFFRCINLCHDCISLKDEKPGKGDCLVYNGPSVDEVCLLEMARDSAIGSFVNRDSDFVKIKVGEKTEQYGIIKIFPFTSERKAMSIVLVHPHKPGKALCYVKGADSSVFPMCRNWAGQGKLDFSAQADDPNNKILEVERTVEDMAKKGLRTLLYGMKEIEWDGTRDPIDLDCSEVECELTLLAATGVEDLL